MHDQINHTACAWRLWHANKLASCRPRIHLCTPVLPPSCSVKSEMLCRMYSGMMSLAWQYFDATTGPSLQLTLIVKSAA